MLAGAGIDFLMREGCGLYRIGAVSVPGSILFESASICVSALAFRALAIIAPAGKSVPVLAI